MSGEDKPKSKTRRILSLTFWLVILAALTLVVLSFIPGKQLGRSVLSEMFISRSPVISVSEFNFEVGRSRVFAHTGGFTAAVGTLGLQVLGPDGQETLRNPFRADVPAVTENNGYFLAYDIGGSSLRVFNSTAVLSAIETDGLLVSASINKNGWFCIVTQEKGSFRSAVAVYNNNGDQVYLVNVGSGFVLSAKLSADNKNLAILNMSDNGSRITYYNGIDSHKDEPDSIHTFGNTVVFDIDFTSNSNILAFSTHFVYTVNFTAIPTENEIYNFENKRLAGYTYTDSFIALHLYDYGIGYSGRTVSIDYNGDVLGEVISTHELISIASDKNTLVLLRSDSLRFFDENLVEFPVLESNLVSTTAGHVLLVSSDMALIASDHFAIVIRREEV